MRIVVIGRFDEGAPLHLDRKRMKLHNAAVVEFEDDVSCQQFAQLMRHGFESFQVSIVAGVPA